MPAKPVKPVKPSPVSQFFTTVLLCLVCLIVGLGTGIFFGPQIKLSPPGLFLASLTSKFPLAKSVVPDDKNSPFESFDYPTIKWRPRAVANAEGGIAQLTTTYESAGKDNPNGTMKYILTMFKVPDKQQCQVQVLDQSGFKIFEFQAGGFHPVPGAADISEARDAIPCSEDDYKKAQDYSVN